VASIPVRLPPLPGEALDSWLEAYARLLHVTVSDIFALTGLDWNRPATGNGHKPWVYRLDEPALAALGAVTGVPADILADMTLARYEGTGLAAVTAEPGMPRTPRWWRQLISSRYCPRCLAANGGRWMLVWRLPWTFACTGCQVLLTDTCPDCGRRHQHARAAQPLHAGCCDLTGLPLPPRRPPRGGIASCTSDPARTPAVTLPADGHVLSAQQHTDALIDGMLTARDQPAELAAFQQYLDDVYAVARAAVSALHGKAPPPAIASAVLKELGPSGSAAGTDAPAGPLAGQRRQLSPVTGFGVTIADIMLHGRSDDPDPAIAAWLAEAETSHGPKAGPANMLAHWSSTSPALQAALVKPVARKLDTFYQLRYRALAGPAGIPDLAEAGQRAAALPTLLWPGWALRLMPSEGFDFLRYRLALAIMLAVACTGAGSYRTVQELLGQHPVHASRFPTFIARLREHGALEPVTTAVCQLARRLDEHGTPVDYARRRRLRRFSQAQLDIVGWRRQRYFLTHPDTWAERRHLGSADLPAATFQEHLARLRLIELLTGIHPYYLPEPLRLPERRGQDYAEFVFTMPEPMAGFLDRQARHLLRHAGIDEPVTWEPPLDWITGISWPGPCPDDINPADLHPLIQAGLPVRAIAARLGTTPEHVRLTAARYPAPKATAATTAQTPGEPEPPGTGQLRQFTQQGFGPRKIARITGCSERVIRQLLVSAGLRQPAPRPGRDIDPQWLREQYQVQQRSLKDIAAETAIPVSALAAAARNAGIPVRQGVNGRAHPLASLGGATAFPPAIWNAFARPHAEQRIRRILALPGQPGLLHAARRIGIKRATLDSQIRQLEDAAGTALLRTGPDGIITLTAHGEEFARDVQSALEALAQSREKDARHAP
jgi:TniQ